jgi:hypothetical protein
MKQLALFTEEYQPRFQAYLDHVGAAHADEVRTHDFVSWIGTHAEAFKQMKGENFIRPSEQDEFTEYVWEQVGR